MNELKETNEDDSTRIERVDISESTVEESTPSTLVAAKVERDLTSDSKPEPELKPATMKDFEHEALAQTDSPDARIRFAEKKRLYWSDKTCALVPSRSVGYSPTTHQLLSPDLAPLTTVGNLVRFHRLDIVSDLCQ